jgi:thiamine-monophosphate kinase
MIDVSDGLLADLGHIADASSVLIDLRSDALLPAVTELLAAARHVCSIIDRTGRPQAAGPRISPPDEALRWVLTGGEDHSLVATFPPEVQLPARWTVIGTVRPGRGVVIDSQPWTQARGWDHFA